MEREPQAQTPPEFRPPDQLEPMAIPDHQLLRRIGRGSYGEVWLAHSVTGAYRAVKIVHRRAFDHDRPFEREFSGILKFEPISRKHDSQLDILHVGRGDDFFFYVMELADDQFSGQDVNPDSYAPKTLKSELFQRGKLPFEECVQTSLALTTALENLHSQGLVHRDIKPANVVFVNGVAKLADIGLVTSVDASRSFVGTEGFVPPEGPGAPQADIYSLGKVLYEVSTGKDRQEFPELPSDLDAWPDREGLLELNAVIAKACREDPRQRYPSAEAMHRDLLLLQSGKSLARLHAAERTLAKLKRTAVVAGAVVLVLAVGLGLAAIGWRQARVERDNALRARAAEEAQRNAAQAAQKLAETERVTATKSQEQARRLLYDSDMRLAQQAVKDNDLDQARRLLDRHRPLAGEADLRGWEWRYLWQLTRNSAHVTLTNRQVTGKSASFSPDGSRLAVGWGDGRIDLWDVPGRRWIGSLHGADKGLDGALVAFSPVRNILATTFGTNAVSLHDLDTGLESVVWRPPSQGGWEVRFMDFSHDGSRMVIYAGTPDRDDAVWVVNVSSGRVERRQPIGYTSSSWFGAAQISPDNQRLYVTVSEVWNYRNTIECLDLVTGREIWRTAWIKDSGLTALAVSPDGKLLASASGWEDPRIRVWDATNGRLIKRLEGHTHWTEKLVFSNDGRRLISAASDQTARIWETRGWTEVKVLRGNFVPVAVSPTGRLIASPSGDGELTLWNTEENEVSDGRLLVPTDVWIMPLDSLRVMSIPSDKQPELFDLSRGVSLGPVPGLGLSTNLDFLSFGTNWLCRWDRTNQIVIDEWNGSQFAQAGAVTVGKGFRSAPALYNSASHLVAWAGPAASNSVFVATLSQAGRRIELKSEVAGLLPYRFSDDGEFLAAISTQRDKFRVWNIDKAQCVVAPSNVYVADAAFAAGGRVLAVLMNEALDANEIRFYDLDHPYRAPRVVRGKHEVSRLAVSPDERLVAASIETGIARLCDAATGELIEDMRGYGFGVAFSKDGRRLISAGCGHDAVKLLDVGTGQELLNISGSGPFLWDASWSEDGDTIFTGAGSQVLQAWHAPSWEEIAATEAKEEAAAHQQ